VAGAGLAEVDVGACVRRIKTTFMVTIRISRARTRASVVRKEEL